MGHFPIQFGGKGLERKLRLRQLSCLLGSYEVAELEFIRCKLWGLQGHGDDSDPAQTLAHLLPSHGFEHLLQLNSQLLSVIHEDAGLQMGKEEGVRAQDLSPGPPPPAPHCQGPQMVTGSVFGGSWGPIKSSEHGRQHLGSGRWEFWGDL